jgi:hypothetical protein
LQSPPREPIDAALDCKLRSFDQERHCMIGVSVMHTCHSEVNEEPKPRMWRARLCKRLLQ